MTFKDLTYREALIIELTYHLAKGNEKTLGYDLEDIILFMRSSVRHKDDKTTLDCLEAEGRNFITEVIKDLNLD